MRRVDLENTVGYALKRAQAAFRSAMDHELRQRRLTVPQYSCLEQLSQQPGRSNAELARGTFVSRQAMHQLLGAMVADGLVKATGSGRDARYRCTAAGERRVADASRAVAAIEDHMLAALGAVERRRMLDDLNRCVDALDELDP